MSDKIQQGRGQASPSLACSRSLEDQAVEYAEALNDIAEMLYLPSGSTAAEIVEGVGRRWAHGIHSCGPQCQRTLCVQRRELREAWHLLNVLQANMRDDGPTWPRVNEWLARNEILRPENAKDLPRP